MAIFHNDNNLVTCNDCNSNLFEEYAYSTYDKKKIKTEDFLLKSTIKKGLKCSECGSLNNTADLSKQKIT